jgi:hypothetical protein
MSLLLSAKPALGLDVGLVNAGHRELAFDVDRIVVRESSFGGESLATLAQCGKGAAASPFGHSLNAWLPSLKSARKTLPTAAGVAVQLAGSACGVPRRAGGYPARAGGL